MTDPDDEWLNRTIKDDREAELVRALSTRSRSFKGKVMHISTPTGRGRPSPFELEFHKLPKEMREAPNFHEQGEKARVLIVGDLIDLDFAYFESRLAALGIKAEAVNMDALKEPVRLVLDSVKFDPSIFDIKDISHCPDTSPKGQAEARRRNILGKRKGRW